MRNYRISDEGYSEVIEAVDIEDAKAKARASWQAGSWDEQCVCSVHIAEIDDDGKDLGPNTSIDVICGDEPEPPDCCHEDGHDWQTPVEIVGGIKENPGVWSLGGTTMRYRAVCSHCGMYRVETCYGVQRNPGQPDKIEYLDADEASTEYADSVTAD